MAFNTKMGEALKNVIEAKGHDGAVQIIKQVIETKKMRPEDFSIKEMWLACQEADGLSTNVHEALTSSAFPKLTGTLINSRIISAYDSVIKLGDELVTTVPSNVENETIAGLTPPGVPEEVGEGQEYPETTVTEKYVTARNIKYGKRIDITEETIMFDKVGQIMMRATSIGEKNAQWKERLILRAVQDLDTTVYRPSGAPTAVYSAANKNLASSNPFGESGMEAVRKLMHQMTDDTVVPSADNDYIYINPDDVYVLVPQDLELESWQLANSALTPESAENAANFFKGRFKPRTSPYITGANATSWYMGDFKRSFWWLEVLPLQTISLPGGGEMSYYRDIKASHKVRFYGSPVCVDPKYVYKSTS